MKICFYADWEAVAMTYLRPVYEHLAANTNWELGFFPPQHIVDKSLPMAKGHLNHDRYFCCDTRSVSPGGNNRIVLFHGLASKSQDFSKHRSKKYVGIHVAPSPYYYDILRDIQKIPESHLILGGLSKFDTIQDSQLERPPNPEPKILYAPTHGYQLSSTWFLGNDILKLAEDFDLTVHAHDYVRQSKNPFQKAQREILETHDVGASSGSSDITQLMLDSDIVIADMGSTVVEAIALGKMVIQVVPPTAWEWHEKAGTTPEEYELLPEVFLPKQFGFQATTLSEIREIINQYPDYPKSDFEVVSNIGEYRVSQILYDYIT